MAKKIVSLLVCLIMALSLLNVVTVSATMTDEVTIYHNDCSVPDGVGSYQKAQAEFAGFTNQNESYYNNHTTNALVYKLAWVNANGANIAQMTSNKPTFFKGGTYKLIVRARASFPTDIKEANFPVKIDFTECGGYYNPVVPGRVLTVTTVNMKFTASDVWQTTEYELTVDGFADEALTEAEPTIIFSYDNSIKGYGNKVSLTIDDIEIKQTNVPKVSVEVGENGTVSCGGNPVADGDSFYKAKGDTVTLDFAPAAGYVAKATVNGAETPVENNQIKVAVNDDTAIDIKFEEIPVVNVGVDDTKTVTNFTNANGEPTIYVYSKIADFTTGEDNLNYGIILGNGSWSEWLYALDAGSDIDNQIRSTAKPGEAYIIKVLGADVSESYKVQPFVGETTGNERTLSFTE